MSLAAASQSERTKSKDNLQSIRDEDVLVQDNYDNDDENIDANRFERPQNLTIQVENKKPAENIAPLQKTSTSVSKTENKTQGSRNNVQLRDATCKTASRDVEYGQVTKKKPASADRRLANEVIDNEVSHSPSRKSPPRSPSWRKHKESPPRSPTYKASPSMSPTEKYPGDLDEDPLQMSGEEVLQKALTEINKLNNRSDKLQVSAADKNRTQKSAFFFTDDDIYENSDIDLARYAAAVANDTVSLLARDRDDTFELERKPNKPAVVKPATTDSKPNKSTIQSVKSEPIITDRISNDLSPIEDVSPSVELMEQTKMLEEQQLQQQSGTGKLHSAGLSMKRYKSFDNVSGLSLNAVSTAEIEKINNKACETGEDEDYGLALNVAVKSNKKTVSKALQTDSEIADNVDSIPQKLSSSKEHKFSSNKVDSTTQTACKTESVSNSSTVTTITESTAIQADVNAISKTDKILIPRKYQTATDVKNLFDKNSQHTSSTKLGSKVSHSQQTDNNFSSLPIVKVLNTVETQTISTGSVRSLPTPMTRKEINKAKLVRNSNLQLKLPSTDKLPIRKNEQPRVVVTTSSSAGECGTKVHRVLPSISSEIIKAAKSGNKRLPSQQQKTLRVSNSVTSKTLPNVVSSTELYASVNSNATATSKTSLPLDRMERIRQRNPCMMRSNSVSPPASRKLVLPTRQVRTHIKNSLIFFFC